MLPDNTVNFSFFMCDRLEKRVPKDSTLNNSSVDDVVWLLNCSKKMFSTEV